MFSAFCVYRVPSDIHAWVEMLHAFRLQGFLLLNGVWGGFSGVGTGGAEEAAAPPGPRRGGQCPGPQARSCSCTYERRPSVTTEFPNQMKSSKVKQVYAFRSLSF